MEPSQIPEEDQQQNDLPTFESNAYKPVPKEEEENEEEFFFEIHSNVSLSMDLSQLLTLNFVVNSTISSSELAVVDLETSHRNRIPTGKKIVGR